MLGLKELCSLLLAGGVGAGSVVAVQQVRAPIKKVAPKPKPAIKRAAPAAASTPAALATQIDCVPTAWPAGPDGFTSPSPSAAPSTGFPTSFSGLPAGPGGGGGAPGWNGGGTIPGGTTPAQPVPEPDAWAMMVSGFGLIGLALRRRSIVSFPGRKS